MGYNIVNVRSSIMNKWDWESPINNVPICVWGSPGIGKTWIIVEVVVARKIEEIENQLSKMSRHDIEYDLLNSKLNRLKNYVDPNEIEDIIQENVLVLRLAERPIEQIEGVPQGNFEHGFTRFLMPENLVHLKKAKWVVVFLDELDKAAPSKMAAATHLIENRCIGDFRLPLDTFIIAAANRTQDSFLSKPVSPELCNRMAHVELDVDVKLWIEWGQKRNVNANIINFHKFNILRNENYLVRYDYGDNEATSPRAFPTCRTWYTGSKLMNKIYARNKSEFGANEEVDNLAFAELEQMVGEAATTELITYVKLFSKVDVKKILTGEQLIPTYQDVVESTPEENEEEDSTKPKSKKAVLSNDKRQKVMGEQYIFAFALIEQLTVDMISKKPALVNLIKCLTAMLPEIRTIFVQTINTTKKDLLRKIANAPESSELVDEIINYLAV